MTKAAQDALPLDQYFVPLDMTGPDVAELAEQARTPYWMGISVYAMVLAYNSKKYGSKPPTNWGDLWDVKGFPGARSLRRHAIDTFEVALLADGTAPDKVFPLDIVRALKKLGEIKSSVDVWWTGGAQTTQMLKSGEVDLCMAWNARAQAAIDDGAPYELCWDKAVWGMDGMCVPKRAKNEEAARNFIRFCANAKRQAVFAKYIGYGPSNPNAFEFIDPARAKILPTDPSRFGKMVYQDPAGWGPAKDKALAAFDAWIIKS
jgi:putative spermidine/putrescine transport system substrate-binding protein